VTSPSTRSSRAGSLMSEDVRTTLADVKGSLIRWHLAMSVVVLVGQTVINWFLVRCL